MTGRIKNKKSAPFLSGQKNYDKASDDFLYVFVSAEYLHLFVGI